MKKILIAGLIGSIVFTTAACSSKQEKNTSASTAPKTEVKQTVDEFGVVKVTDVKNITVDFSAVVSKISVKDGQKVKSGDILASLDLSDYQSQISGKERQISSEKLELERLINSTQSDQNELKKLQKDFSSKQDALTNSGDPEIKKVLSDLKNAQELYEKAKQELTSKESLFKSGALSQYELDEFKKSVDSKKKAVDDAKLAIDITKDSKQKELDQIKSNVDQKLAQLDNKQSGTDISRIKIQREKIAGLEDELKIMKNKLNRSYIKQSDLVSDVANGVVYDIGFVQGDIVSPSRKFLSIMDLDSMVVEANISEEFIKDVKVGADVTIIPQADKSKSYKGKVISLSDKAMQKNNDTSVLVRISIDNKDEFLLPEFNVDVKIAAEQKK